MAPSSSLAPAALAAVLLLLVPAMAVDYYVAADGADANAGTSPDAAWRTLARVNAAELLPGC